VTGRFFCKATTTVLSGRGEGEPARHQPDNQNHQN